MSSTGTAVAGSPATPGTASAVRLVLRWMARRQNYILAAAALVALSPYRGRSFFRRISLLPPAGLRKPALTRSVRYGAPRGQKVELSHGQTHYQFCEPASASERTPLIVYIHGFTTASYCWDDALVASKEAGYRTLSYDMYGRGWSDSPDVPHEPALFVAQLAELLDHVARIMPPSSATEEPTSVTPPPVTLVGHSMGGIVALEFARAYPTRVSRLVLVSPAGPNFDIGATGRLLCTDLLGDVLVHNLGRRLMCDYEGALVWVDNPERARQLKHYQEQFNHQCDHHPGYLRSQLATLRHFPFMDREDLFVAVGKHPRPVHLVWGDADNTTPLWWSDCILQLMPRATRTVIADVGHLLMVEKSGETCEAILSFVMGDAPDVSGHTGVTMLRGS